MWIVYFIRFFLLLLLRFGVVFFCCLCSYCRVCAYVCVYRKLFWIHWRVIIAIITIIAALQQRQKPSIVEKLYAIYLFDSRFVCTLPWAHCLVTRLKRLTSNRSGREMSSSKHRHNTLKRAQLHCTYIHKNLFGFSLHRFIYILFRSIARCYVFT